MPTSATCFVSAEDFRQHWQASVTHPVVPSVWNGEERRIADRDRRVGHDRRWEQARGRRGRLADRRTR